MFDCLHDSCEDGQNQENVQNQGQQNRKTREELVDDLADCLERLKDPSDLEEFDRILEELGRLDPSLSNFDAEQSLARFYEKYGPRLPKEPPAKKKKKPRSPKARTFARNIAIIAILLCVFLGAAQAAGWNILRIFPWWNGEQFHFSQEEEGDSNLVDSLPETEFESLQAALDKYGVQVPLAPSKLPDDAVMLPLTVEEQGGQLVFRAIYTLSKGNLFITIEQASEELYADIETNEETMIIYTVDGIEHRIMEDAGMQKATWNNGIWEGRISGNVSQEELIAMIDSIYQ